MIFLQLFYTFFLIGVFGFGGGYGMLSLIQTETVHNHAWLTSAEFTNIVAVSQMTPGPIGINSATYCGYTAVHNAGYAEPMALLGSLTATVALMLPSLILMILICKVFMRYMHTRLVESIFAGLRPAVVGLLGAAALLLLTEDNFGSMVADPWRFWVSVAIFLATFVGTRWVKVNPIHMIALAAFAGLMLLSCTPRSASYTPALGGEGGELSPTDTLLTLDYTVTGTMAGYDYEAHVKTDSAGTVWLRGVRESHGPLWERRLGADELQQLQQIVIDEKMYAYKEHYSPSTQVLDGQMWSFHASYKGGQLLSSGGTNAWPPGNGLRRIEEYVNQLVADSSAVEIEYDNEN